MPVLADSVGTVEAPEEPVETVGMLPMELSAEDPVEDPVVYVPEVLEPAEPVGSVPVADDAVSEGPVEVKVRVATEDDTVGIELPLGRVSVPGVDEIPGPVLDTSVVPDETELGVPGRVSVGVVPCEVSELGPVVPPLLVSLETIVVPVDVKVDVKPPELVVTVTVKVEVLSVAGGPVVLPPDSPPLVVESVLILR